MRTTITSILIAAGLLLPAHDSEAAGPSFSKATRFTVTVRRLVFKAERAVEVRVSGSGLNGTVAVELDRPVRSVLGIMEATFRVRILRADGRLVDDHVGGLEDGMSRFDFPVEFPAPGTYRLVIENDDLDVGPAHASIRPGGRASVSVTVGKASAQLLARSHPETSDDGPIESITAKEEAR